MANTRFNATCPSCENEVPVTSSASIGTKIECPKCKYRFTCPPPPGDESAKDAAGGEEGAAPAGAEKPKKSAKKGGSTVLVGSLLAVLGIAVVVGGAVFVLGDSEEPKKVAQNPRPVPPPPPPDTETEPMPPDTGKEPKEGEPKEPAKDGKEPKEPSKDGKEPKEPTKDGKEPKETIPVTPKPKDGKEPKETLPVPTPKNPPDVTPKVVDPPKAVVQGPKTAEVKRPPRTTPLPEVTNLIPGDAVAVYQLNMAQATKTPFYAAFFDQTIRELFQESFFFRSELISTTVHAVVGPNRDPFVVIRTDSPIDSRLMLDLWGPSLSIPKNNPVRGRYFYLISGNPFVRAVLGAFTPDSLAGQFGLRLPPAPRNNLIDRPIAFHAYDDQTIILTTETVMERFLNDLQSNGYPTFRTEVQELKPAAPPPPKDGAPPAPTPPAPAPGAPPTKRLFTTIRNFQTVEPDLKRTLNALEPEVGQDPPALLYAEIVDQRLLASRNVGLSVSREVPMLYGFVESIKVLGLVVTSFANDRMVGTMSLEFTSDDDAKTAAHQKVLPTLYPASVVLGNIMNTPVYLVNEVTAPPPPPVPADAPPGSPPRPPMPPTPTIPGLAPGLTGFPLGVMPTGTPLPVVPDTPMPGAPPPPGGAAPGAPGAAPPPSTAPKLSTITVSTVDRVMNIKTALGWNEDRFNARVTPTITRSASQFRGKMVVLSGLTEWHSLSTAAVKLVSRKQPFPHGALERDAMQDRFRLPFPPETRTSFLADLLPYIGRAGLRSQIQDRKYAWYAKENLPAAEAWVPEFLIPSYPPNTWRATHPFVADGRQLGATNFVGLAGVGVDAARYNPADPEFAKKVGITGYEWGSTALDVKDGLSNTAYLIQAPPGMPRPWITGGGATLVGVEDSDDALKPFLSPGPRGRGTHVLMADGSVRFVKEGANPAVFKAMTTRAGGENLADLDGVAPKLPPSRGVELRGGGAVGAVPFAPDAPAPRTAGKGG